MADSDIVEMTSAILSAYVGSNTISAQDLPGLIRIVHAALTGVATGAAEATAAPEKIVPFISIRRSITPDWLISLEDGRKFKSLKRHLSTKGMTPDDYRAKWGLPKEYPMVAPNYAAARSALAKSIGLGQGGRPAVKATAKTTATPQKPRGRPRKTPAA